MILIADSGSTKTDWCIVFNGTLIKRIGTKGINPFFQSEEEIQQELTASLLPPFLIRPLKLAERMVVALFTPHVGKVLYPLSPS